MTTTDQPHVRDDHSDPTLYRTPADAVAAPAENFAYVVGFDPTAQRADALFTVGTDPESPGYGRVTSQTELPDLGNELHHFGWNACSSALAHAGHHHAARRYLIV